MINVLTYNLRLYIQGETQIERGDIPVALLDAVYDSDMYGDPGVRAIAVEGPSNYYEVDEEIYKTSSERMTYFKEFGTKKELPDPEETDDDPSLSADDSDIEGARGILATETDRIPHPGFGHHILSRLDLSGEEFLLGFTTNAQGEDIFVQTSEMAEPTYMSKTEAEALMSALKVAIERIRG